VERNSWADLFVDRTLQDRSGPVKQEVRKMTPKEIYDAVYRLREALTDEDCSDVDRVGTGVLLCDGLLQRLHADAFAPFTRPGDHT
jgi:NADPH:quinone reductase-like Zn-dependent oxidoreductase